MCGGAPEAPDLGPQAEASKYAADKAFEQAMVQMDWAREQQDRMEALLERTLGPQIKMQTEQWEMGKEDRARYKEKYQGMEDSMIAEANDYLTPERMEQNRGRSMAGVQQAFESQRENAQQRLEQYGIDPSQTRAQAIDMDARTKMAAAQAGAGNAADSQTEAVGRALRSEAVNVGRGYQGQVAQSYAGALNAGNSAVNNQAQGTAAGVNAQSGAQGWMSSAQNGYSNSANIMSQGFQNEMATYQANADNSWGAALGQVAGTALGAAASFHEGGVYPKDAQPAPATGGEVAVPGVKGGVILEEGEYIVPKDVVAWKGEEFFEKLKSKTREDKAGDKPADKPTQGVPMGVVA